MTDSQVLDWVATEFYPVTLITPSDTILQNLQNAKRYWNTNSAYPIAQMFDASSGTPRIQLPVSYKNVYKVLPATQPDWILANYPVWSLLGITVIDNLSSDLIELGEAYKNYRYYLGMDFQWNYQKSEDPTIGGYLYLSNLPSGVSKLCVVGSARIVDNTDITSEYILDWILKYTKALTKLVEGNTIRKSTAIKIDNDGQQLIDEGKEEVKTLQEQLVANGRWTAFCRRF